MSTSVMVWGLMWRATLLLLASGAVLGGLYGTLWAVSFAAPIFTNDYPDYVMSESEELLAAASGFLFMSFIGGIFGAMVGAAMGLAAGLILGTLLAALTRAYFSCAPDPGAYRRAAGGAGVVAPLPLAPVLWALYGSSTVAVVLVVVVPVLVLSLAGWFVGKGVAGWWSGKSA